MKLPRLSTATELNRYPFELLALPQIQLVQFNNSRRAYKTSRRPIPPLQSNLLVLSIATDGI